MPIALSRMHVGASWRALRLAMVTAFLAACAGESSPTETTDTEAPNGAQGVSTLAAEHFATPPRRVSEEDAIGAAGVSGDFEASAEPREFHTNASVDLEIAWRSAITEGIQRTPWEAQPSLEERMAQLSEHEDEARDGSTLDDNTVTLEELHQMASDTDAVSLAEFRDAHRTVLDGKAVFRVESDILLWTEEQLERHYYEDYLPRQIEPTGKLIVNLIEVLCLPPPLGCSTARDKRGSTWGGGGLFQLDIKYCFSSGWGTAQYDSNLDGTNDVTVPTQAAMLTALETATRAWEGVASVRFRHVASLDGAGCSTSGSNPGVDFVVQHYNATTCTGTNTPAGCGLVCGAFGAFPSNSWANQQLLVPPCAPSDLLMIHEVGHVLGFRHEHIHSGASPQCGEGGTEGTDYEELTEFDTDSAMKYTSCTVSANINGVRPSRRDGIGARLVYGNPHWWWAVAL